MADNETTAAADTPRLSRWRIVRPRTATLRGAQFANDGKSLLVATDKDAEFHRLARLDLESKQFTVLTPELNWGAGQLGGGTWNNTAYRHAESANFLMFDGHAENKAKREAWTLNASGSTNWGPINRLWDAYRKR